MGPAPRRGCLHPEEGAPGRPGAREADWQVPSETGREVHPSGWLRGPGPAAPAWVSVPGGPPATVVTVSSELPSGQPRPPASPPSSQRAVASGQGVRKLLPHRHPPRAPGPAPDPAGRAGAGAGAAPASPDCPRSPRAPHPRLLSVSLRRRTRLRRGSSGEGRGGCWPPSGCDLSPGNRRHRNTSRRCHLLLAELKSSPRSTRAPGAAWGSWRVGPGG